jgi:hypothetical protein
MSTIELKSIERDKGIITALRIDCVKLKEPISLYKLI